MSPSAVSATPPQAVVQGNPDLSADAVKAKLSSAASLAPLDASKLTRTRTTTPRTVPALDDPIRNVSSFATDHMITCTWNVNSGWGIPELKPYGPFSIMPTASVLHYATECFEGLKCYRGYDGKLRLFRPDCNAKRLLMSSARIALPTFDTAEVEKLITELVAVDGDKFLPKSNAGKFLYLRPTMIGTQAELGVQTPNEAMLFIIATYMPELSETPGGMKLLASQNDIVRAWPGGFGFAKVGANYGPSLMAQQEARRLGYNQVLWLLGDEAQVTEAGASNFFTVMRTKEGKLQLITAPLGDKVILDGVTRRSVIQLVKERLAKEGGELEALEVVERQYTMGEIVEASEEGRLIECFACGTAFFVAPVSKIHFRGVDIDVPMAQGEVGDYTNVIKNWLVDIMYGREDHPWGVVVEEKEV
ncbi:hypothetical protein VC83_03874 [Pseudogymnoascus destructans]|uniref:Branched-chain-amino-acid aminotransferase n=2 Tax=Pseudogymnoascus destructans TaxID=655981 RepID=L8G742_PSED2|nr:uncharacterized protein VC83_03874 [Pseudogymnoascus destructans]ELR08649.1 hypothetical protein GMDG_03335 [Pseudogymnoascus destructans 20631-21]OAF59830.1 hypothetical protein VC83_03874 [Pseudogymnoascus destructans]